MTAGRTRTRAVLSTLAALAMGATTLALPSTASAAPARTFTWTCTARNGAWTDVSCWDQAAVPDDGDSVVIQSDTPITDVPAVTLVDLTYAGGDHGHLDAPDGVLGGLTVTGHLAWSGGAINMPLRIAASAVGTLSAGAPKSVGGDLTVQGSLVLRDIGSSDDDGGLSVEIPKLGSTGYSTLLVSAGGSLVATGSNQIMGAACCSDAHPIALVDQGTVSVPAGTLTLRALLLDQAGTVSAARGARLEVVDSVARLRAGSAYRGPGTVVLSHDGPPSPDPEHPEDNQGAVLLDGTATLADGLTLALQDGTALTGTGTLAGSGVLRLDDATVYGDVSTTAHVTLDVVGADASHVGTWTQRQGYVGQLDLGGPATVHAGTTLQTDAGGSVTVARGGLLDVPATATLAGPGAGGSPSLVVADGGTLRLGGAGAGGAQVRSTGLRVDGTLDVVGPTTWTGVTASQPGGTLRLASRLSSDGGYALGAHATVLVALHRRKAGQLRLGGRARLAGTVRTTGHGSHARGRRLRIVRSHGRAGTFSCEQTRGWTVAYSHAGARLTGVGVTTPKGCGRSVTPRTLLHRKVGAHPARTTVPAKHAAAVLLAVTVRAHRSTTVRLRARHGGHARLRTHGHRTLHRYVVVRLRSATRLTVRSQRHHRAAVTVRYVARYR